MTNNLAGKTTYRVAIVAPTCFYYQAELFRALAGHPRIDLSVYFCSDEGIRSLDVLRMYKSNRVWGETDELLRGYKSKLLRNFSLTPSYLKWPFGLVNLGIWAEIRKTKPHAIVIMSWMNPTWWLTILASRWYGIPLLYLTDANVRGESTLSRWKRLVKRLALSKAIFRTTTAFLCAGTANMDLYRFYGVPDEKLFPFAYSWGYGAYLHISDKLKASRARIRASLGLPETSCVILYCGRLAKEKGIEDLLEAYRRIKAGDVALVIVGDGVLRGKIRDYIARNNIRSVFLLGFQNRNEIQSIYAMADAVVLPSLRETWGIVVSEAMCFSLPVIVSEAVGAGVDLVVDGYNGYKFAQGDVAALAKKLDEFLSHSEEEKIRMGTRSRLLIEQWSQRDLAVSLTQNLDLIYSRRE